MADLMPADPMPAALDLVQLLDPLLGTPCPETFTFDGETIWFDEIEKARRYIIDNFDVADWPEQVARFRRDRFLATVQAEDGIPVLIAGCHDLFLADFKRRRAEEAAEAEARIAADPQRQVQRDEHTAAAVRDSARRFGRRGGSDLPERARTLTIRARLARVRLLVGRIVPARHGGREHRARRRRRATARTAARRGDPDPAGDDPEPPKRRQP